MMDPTGRFSSRVENYIKYRPKYPPVIIDLLKEECQLTDSSIIADVGSGTGLLTELFLKNGNCVYGLEPNREMREAGERLLKSYARFTSVASRAESSTLADESVDFVTSGRAFQWFDHEEALREFSRILRPQGWVVIVWIKRRASATPFLAAYERLLLTQAIDYQAMKRKRDELERLLGLGGLKVKTLEHEETFDYDRLKGQLLSYSISPEAGQENFNSMLDELSAIFQDHQENGNVTFEYDTTIYYGQLLSKM